MFGERLLPIGTVYDPFISRGLDALNYACYQDARFIVVGHAVRRVAGVRGRSAPVDLRAAARDGPSRALTAFEPTYADELCEILRWSFEHLQADEGGAVYLRLSTRPVEQPDRRLNADLARQITDGGYWLAPPGPRAEVALVASGAVLPETIEAHRQILEDIPDAGLLVVTSVDRLYRGWLASHRGGVGAARSTPHVERLLETLPDDAGLITVIDAHPATLSWLATVRRQRVVPLGVDRFGQSGDLPDLYREYRLDVDAIVDAAARVAMSAGA